ncbi:unnamed protein product [Effrenium voratum]|nr:unnamed protein product [Effrenium voratum]
MPKRKSDCADEELHPRAQALKELPRQALLGFRRELALQPFPQALCHLQEWPRLVDELRDVEAKLVAEAVALALGGDIWCWALPSTVEEVDAAQGALKTMLEDGRQRLLAALRNGDNFCAAVKQHCGKKDGQALMRLGKTRVMWLLGASPEEGIEWTKRKRRRPRRKGKQVTEAESEESFSSEKNEPSEAKKTHDATLQFLRSIREKRNAKMQETTC